jgi:hypothetical protein
VYNKNIALIFFPIVLCFLLWRLKKRIRMVRKILKTHFNIQANKFWQQKKSWAEFSIIVFINAPSFSMWFYVAWMRNDFFYVSCTIHWANHFSLQAKFSFPQRDIVVFLVHFLVEQLNTFKRHFCLSVLRTTFTTSKTEISFFIMDL